VVAGVDMWGEDGLVLATKQACDLGGQPSENGVFGVDDVPGFRDVTGLW